MEEDKGSKDVYFPFSFHALFVVHENQKRAAFWLRVNKSVALEIERFYFASGCFLASHLRDCVSPSR